MSQSLELPELIAFSEMGDLSGYRVVRHGYEEARVIGDDVVQSFDYTSGDALDRLHHALAEMSDGKRADNKECYEVEKPGQQRMCLWFHDWKFTLGTGIRPYPH